MDKLDTLLGFSGQHICKLRPTEAPTFYLVPTTDTQPRSIYVRVTVDVTIVKPLTEQSTGENKHMPGHGNATNGAQHSHPKKRSHAFYFSVIENREPESSLAQV